MDPITRIIMEKVTVAMIVAKLTEAKGKIERGWCQRHMATSRTGTVRSPHQRDAVKFCIMGALTAVTPGMYEIRRIMRWAIVSALPPRERNLHQITEWNDNSARTKEEVAALFDTAIANVNNGNIKGPSTDEHFRIDPSKATELKASLAR